MVIFLQGEGQFVRRVQKLNNMFKGNKMARFRVRLLLCAVLFFTLLFAPLVCDFYPGGTAYAGSWWWRKPPPPDIPPGNDDRPPAPVPEPATWLLVGAGAAGLIALRKKFKK